MDVCSRRGQLQFDTSRASEVALRTGHQRDRSRLAEQILDRREKALQAGLCERYTERLLCLAWEAYHREADYVL